MTKKETTLSTAQPACYCCLRETNLIEHNNGKGLVYWLCCDCDGAGFKKVDGLLILVCPCHGLQHHLDVDNVKYHQRWASKKKYFYDAPVHTKMSKEKGNAPMFILEYDEVKV